MIKKPVNEHFFDKEYEEMWYILGASYNHYFPETKSAYNTWSSSNLNLINIIKRELESEHSIIIEEATKTYELRIWNEKL